MWPIFLIPKIQIESFFLKYIEAAMARKYKENISTQEKCT